MRDKTRFIAVRRPRIDVGHTKDAGANVSLPRVIFHVAFADQLRPFERSLSQSNQWDKSPAPPRKESALRAIDVFGRRVDECRAGPQMS